MPIILHRKQKTEIAAEGCILPQKCCYDDLSLFGCGLPSWLRNMDRTDPCCHGFNLDDYQLQKKANKLGKNLHVLAYLSTYGHLCNTFFEGYRHAQQDLSFQARIISIYKDEIVGRKKDSYSANFGNMVCSFLKHWDFAPEIKKIIFEDERFNDVARIYDLFRNRETGKLLRP